MRTIIKSIGNIKNSIILFLLFAFFSGLATFIESAYGTPTAWAMIYGTLWFGFLQLLLGINLLCAMFIYKMFMLKKFPLMLFHLSFLFILLGSAMTRYGGYEGILSIRENESNSVVVSSKSFIKFSTLKDNKIYGQAMQKDIAVLPFANNFELNLKVGDGDEKAKLSYKNLILDAKEVMIEDENASALLSFMLADKNGNSQIIKLTQGEIKTIDGVNFGFLVDKLPSPYVKIDQNLNLSSSNDLEFFAMQTGENGVLKAGKNASTDQKRLYNINGNSFVIQFASLYASTQIQGINRPEDESFWLWFGTRWIELARTSLIALFGEASAWKNEPLLSLKTFAMDTKYQPHDLKMARNALELEVEYKGEKANIFVFEFAKPSVVELSGEKFFIAWNTSVHELPFEVYLRDFQLDRYAGSMSPKSYASEITVTHGDKKFDYRIFMNNVLDYEGYRFYQSSYDQDEKGTILSVNKDPGKIPTYIGYILLSLGMFLNILNPNSRFRILAKLVNKDALKYTSAIAFASLVFFTNEVKAQELPQISDEHAKSLSTLIVQRNGGRMVPFDTLAREILEKVHKNSSYKGQNANAVMLSMLVNAKIWADEKIIAMPPNTAVRKEIAKILGLDENIDHKYVSYNDFLNADNTYKIQRYVENANRQNQNARGVFNKEILKLDERFNIVALVFYGELFKIFPAQNAINNEWYSFFEAMNQTQNKEQAIIFTLFQNYINSAIQAIQTGDWEKANQNLTYIKAYQNEYGASIIPSDSKIKTELFVNKAQIFVELIKIYLVAGILLLVLVFTKMLKSSLKINFVFKAIYIFNIIAFLIHTLGLGLRWYLAERAPWSNAYESMVYIAWALALSGIFFSRKSPIALSLTSILAGITLMVAHLNEMDPQITNIMPVLNSYWLSIHVSVITASYGFLGLCALLGIFVLVLMCFLRKDGKANGNILRNITEATRISEMAMILGLCLLTVGNFLGAVWANESWGRYWSWDSKETWALVSILVYAAILHLRMIPNFLNQYNFALISMFAYWSIIMTYFGVNYFLVGLHSYAAGEAAKIPDYVYWGFLAMVILGFVAYFKRSYVKKV
ncbi:cytochrome c biogenesis protein CcsA [Campylobacter sp. CCS1377]|uniref:Cytochrome c biogenesis protein CcsA n=1 Tax=Campylobacter sp. CCS1377 TaxID=3158229 RepID=A0AAU7E4H2_9BACT